MKPIRVAMRTARVAETQRNTVLQGYGADWKRCRLRVLAAEPLCRHCRARGRVRPATEVDHVIDIVDAPHRRLDETNLQPLCKPCHSAKTRSTQMERSR